MLAIGLAFLCLALPLCLWSLPIPNEAWFADPARNLIEHGDLGTRILSSQGIWLAGVDRHTYWVMPVHLLLQAAWYQVAGFSLCSLRFLSALCGMGLLAAWSFILRGILSSANGAGLGVFLQAIDYQFLRNTTYGRMDALCALLGGCGLALYVKLRLRHPRRALLAGHCFASLSILTHPCGVIYALDLIALAALLDGFKPTWRAVLAGSAPYLAAALSLLLWASADFPSFLSQLGRNVSGLMGEFDGAHRFSGLAHPWTALLNELTERYLGSYPPVTGLVVLWVYLATLAWVLARPPLRKEPGVRILLALAALHFSFFWIFEGLKLGSYLIHVVPLLASLAAVAVPDFASGRRLITAGVLLGIVILDASTVRKELQRCNVQDDFQPVVRLLRSYPGQPIAGPAEFAFALGFEGPLQDLVRMGYYSGRRPALYITNSWQRRWLHNARGREPSAAAFVRDQLDASFRRIFRSPYHEVWLRRP